MTGTMVDGADPVDDAARLAAAQGRRMAHRFVLAVAVLFIGSSGWQIARALFFEGATSPASSPAERACASAVHDLAGALERASARVVAGPVAATDPGFDRGLRAFRASLSPEWDAADAVRRTCEATHAGAETWAALERLRLAEQQLARRNREDLDPLRHDLAAHLPPDLR